MPASGDVSLPRTSPAFRDAARTCSSNAEVPVPANARPTFMTLPFKRRSPFTFLALAAALTAAACTVDETGTSGADPADTLAADTPATDPAAVVDATDGPTLRVVMAGLQTDMDSLHHALWREDFPAAAAAGRAVAEHPAVSEDERQRIFGILGEDAAAFRAADMLVHDTGLALADAASGPDRDAVRTQLANLHAGCLACHEAFRERLLGAAPPPLP